MGFALSRTHARVGSAVAGTRPLRLYNANANAGSGEFDANTSLNAEDGTSLARISVRIHGNRIC